MKKIPTPAWKKAFKQLNVPIDVMLLCVRRYLVYPLNLRHLEERMDKRGGSLDHATLIAG